MRSKYYLVGLALFTVLLLSNYAYGCSCGVGSGAPTCETLGRVGAVFVGTVTGMSTAPLPQNREEVEKLRRAVDAGEFRAARTFKFSLELAFLGVDGMEVEIGTGYGGGDCGYNFVPGKRYLVYAYRSKNNQLSTSSCSETKPYELADGDIKFLNTLSSLAHGVTIRGEIKRQQYNLKTGTPKATGPVADVSVLIEGQDERREIRADAQGRYQVSGLRAGKYKVTLSLPEDLTSPIPEHAVNISDRGCATVDYYVRDNGVITGRVFDAEGQPVEKVRLDLLDPDGLDIERDQSLIVHTDGKGRYSFKGVPPGRYIIALNWIRFPEPNDPTTGFPRTYFPGVLLASQASVITVGAGEKLTDQDLRLPQRNLASVIKGTVTWADGTPVANALISFRNVTYSNSSFMYQVRADELGRFTINAYQSQTIVMAANSDQPWDSVRNQPLERADPVRITLANASEPVKIVITKLR